MHSYRLPEQSSLIVKKHSYSSTNLNAYIAQIRKSVFLKFDSETIDKIVICLPRNVYLIAAVLFCLQSKHTFILVDPSTLSKRASLILNDCNPSVIITSKSSNIFKVDANNMILVDNMFDSNTATQCEELSNTNQSIAYTCYTSGSTGQPKGVMVSHESLINLINVFGEFLNGYKSTVAFANASFDFFISDTIIPLLSGLTVHLADENEQSNAFLGFEFLRNANIDLLQITPARLKQFLTLSIDDSWIQNLKCIMVGGDQLSDSLLKTMQLRTNAKIFNLYGPTEGCVWSTVADLTDSDMVHAGKPLSNVKIRIASPNNQGIGEVIICGLNVAAGYLNMPALTKERFFMSDQGMPCYKTGDVGKLTDENNLIVSGRIDNQVKLRGYRIELEEIENVVLRNTHITQACSCIMPSQTGEDTLWLVYSSKQEIEFQEMQRFLVAELPSYMQPDKIVHMDKLPINSNWKIDRIAIKNKISEIEYANKCEVSKSSYEDYNNVQKIVITAVEQISNNPNLTPATSLKQIGMNSIDYVELIVKLEEIFDFEFDDELLAKDAFSSISEIIKYIGRKIV